MRPTSSLRKRSIRALVTLFATPWVLSASACSGASAQPDGKPARGATSEASPDAPASTSQHHAIQPSDDHEGVCASDADLPCDPVLWMACHPRQAIASRYCETCAGEPACPTEDATLEARLTSQPAIAGFACEEYGYAINAILALHGQPLDDASWQGYLAARPWYTPRSPTPLPPASTANLNELRAALKACQRTNPTTPDDRARVADWFKTFESTGVPPASPVYSFDDAPTSADTLTAIIDQLTSEGGFAFTRRTPLRAHGEGGTLTLRPSERASAAPEGIPYARMLDVRPHLSAMMSCAEPERCEGYARLTLYLDADGELLAQDITAAE